jgi:uncharacterized membrane protein YphA (DoxX/SURF4 family)
VGLAQFAGGLAILSGVLIRLGIIIVVFGAIFLVNLPHGFDVTKGASNTISHSF